MGITDCLKSNSRGWRDGSVTKNSAAFLQRTWDCSRTHVMPSSGCWGHWGHNMVPRIHAAKSSHPYTTLSHPVAPNGLSHIQDTGCWYSRYQMLNSLDDYMNISVPSLTSFNFPLRSLLPDVENQWICRWGMWAAVLGAVDTSVSFQCYNVSNGNNFTSYPCFLGFQASSRASKHRLPYSHLWKIVLPSDAFLCVWNVF